MKTFIDLTCRWWLLKRGWTFYEWPSKLAIDRTIILSVHPATAHIAADLIDKMRITTPGDGVADAQQQHTEERHGNC